jgi:alpha-tubulin suppressor-like RCC1 family protein
MRLRLVSCGVAIVAVLVACVGDDPAITGPGVGGADGGAGGKALGEACSPTDHCASGTCADGVCCDKACTGTCEACDATGHCGAVKGKPKHGTCDGDATGPCAGSCDGMNTAACAYPTVACGAPASCAANIATLPAACKAGTCGATSTQTCALGCFADGCLGVTQVAAGYSFACAVLSDKKVRCWGDNSTGQVGQGAADSTPAYRKPIEVPNLPGVKAMAATFGTACALMDGGTVRCWGSNTGGGLGLGTTDNVKHDVSAAIPGITGATFLAGSSGGHFCAIVAGGALKCWGGNNGGQLGDGTVSAPKAPTSVCQPGSTALPCTPATGVTFVAGGDSHTCATFAGGQVACWGRNDVGELGQTADAVAHPFPKNVPGLTATYLTAGNQVSCAATGGGAKCWGGVVTGILGHGQDVGAAATPVAVCTKQDCSTLLTGVTAVSNYDVSACALAGGAVKCWGDNTGGQLGDGNATSAQNFAGSTAIASGAVQITSGGQTNYAIVVDRANRDIRCWGANFSGECGDNAPAATSHKVPVAPAW